MPRLDEIPSGPVPEPDSQTGGLGQDALSSSLETAAPLVGQDGEETRPIFAPGAIVAGRYRIIRFIAQGGMGQVYEAQDQEFGESVALKTLRPEVARSDQACEFFKREIQLARKVTHPSVCRIFDIGRHRLETAKPEDAPQQDLLFFTMELLDGESLRQRVQRTGKMRPAEALWIIQQMADALRAAHAAGVVHRDFKSQNVLLVRKAGQLRVVVTDFGLACPSSIKHGPDSCPPGTEAMIGTPAYMAPEQVEGKELRPATDVYSFGIVMYEMLTGRLPFQGANALETATMRLKEDPASPRVYAPELAQRWERTILRCLERDPRDRFPSATEAVQMLMGEDTNRMDRPRPKPQERSRIPILLGMLALAAGGFTTSLMIDRAGMRTAGELAPPGTARNATPAPVTLRRPVAILGFKNTANRPEAAWIAGSLDQMLRIELTNDRRLRVLSDENVARMKTRLGIADADASSLAILGQIRAVVGADFVVLGSYEASSGQDSGPFRVEVSVVDTRTGEVVATIVESGDTGPITERLQQVSRQLREKLGAAPL